MFLSKDIKNATARQKPEDLKYLAIKAVRDACYNENNVTLSEYWLDFPLDNDSFYCDFNFDGLLCWSRTPAGATAFQNCPSIISKSAGNRVVFRNCLKDGDWESPAKGLRYSVGFAECFESYFDPSLDFIGVRTAIWATLLICLLISLFLYSSIRYIKCFRLRIHINLFCALLLDNAFWIMWIMITTNSFEMTADNIMAWALPIMGVSAFITARINNKCYRRTFLEPWSRFWICSITSIIAIFTAMYFILEVFIMIVVISQGSSDEGFILFLLKAWQLGVVLIPLFGFHYLLLPIRIIRPRSQPVKLYDIFFAILFSLYDTCTLLITCITDSELFTTAHQRIDRFFRVQVFRLQGAARNCWNRIFNREHQQ